MTDYLNLAISAVIEAGKVILEVYDSKDFDVQLKSDNSPLTRADILSHNIIKSFLEKTGIPILSEEGKETPYEVRKHWSKLWIIDPIDGTKEFIKRNGEFTINVALIENQEPILGVVYAPDLGDLYFDTSSNVIKVYGSAGWTTAASAVNGTADRFKYTATGSQTTFSGVDDSGNTLGYDSGYLDVYLNGVKLVNGTDFTATNGTSIVLASAAVATDILEVIAYGTFQLANFNIDAANDVTKSGITDGQYLQWNATTSQFEPSTIAITPAEVSDQANTSTGYFDLPAGTTAQRPTTSGVADASGYLRFNTTINLAEFYDGTNWRAIDAPPTVTSVSPSTVLAANTTIAITGTNFSSGASVKFIGNDGTEYLSPTVAVNSTTSIDADTPATALTVANEPYDVKVINSSGLSGVLENAIDAGSTPTWTTAAGNIGTVYEDVAIGSLSVVATDADAQAVTISLASGSSLPNGISLSSSGSFTGTPNANGTYSSLGVTHNFDLEATDGVNTATRSFNIIRKWYDGTSSGLATTIPYLLDNGITSNLSGVWLENPASGISAQQYNLYYDATNSDLYIKLNGSWIASNATITTYGGNYAGWTYNSNKGVYCRGDSAVDADLGWGFSKYFLYMHSTYQDGQGDPDDTMQFTSTEFTSGISGGTVSASGPSDNAYISRTETDANGNTLTLTPAALMLNAYSPSNSGNQAVAFGTPNAQHPWKRGGEFAPNFQSPTGHSNITEIMFNMMPGSSYTGGTIGISNTAGTAPTNYRNFPASSGSSSNTKFRVAYDDASEIMEIPDVEIWIRATN